MTRIRWMEVYMTKAEEFIYTDRIGEGLALLDNLLYEEPGYGPLHNHLGWAYLYYTEDIARAELHLKMAIHFDETFSAPYLHLGVLYIRRGKYNEAIEILETGLTKGEPNRVAFLESLGQAYELRGEWRKAINAYKGAVMASAQEHEVANLMAGIKRCQRKRITLFFQGRKTNLRFP